MDYFFGDVLERDIDLLLLRCFVEKSFFRNELLKKVGLSDKCVVEKAYHSLSDENGESDITFIVKNHMESIGILIENKINANSQPEQANRYLIRGNKGVENGDYRSFKVLITAPNEYLLGNQEAKKYQYQISYEYLQSLFDDSSFEYQILARALQKKGVGYEPKEVKELTAFNDMLCDYVKQNYPMLVFNSEKGAKKGPGCIWFSFRTPIKNAWIVYKSNKKYIDLELRGMGDRYQDFFAKNEMVLHGLRPRKAGKSLAIELDTLYDLDCYQPFLTQEKAIKEAMDKVVYLQEQVLPKLILT